MHDVPRQTLCDLIATYGRELCADPRRCESLLWDFCGQHRREIHLLISALKAGVPEALQEEMISRDLLISRLVQGLHQDLGLVEPLARWAVESWALALGKLTPAENRPTGAAAHSAALDALPAPQTVFEMMDRLSQLLPDIAHHRPLLQGIKAELGSLLGLFTESVPPLEARPAEREAASVKAPMVGEALDGLRVSPAGHGQFTTIGEAMLHTPPGGRIRVAPGVYQECLVLEKPLEIIGDGPRQDIILENDASFCIQMRAPRAVVRGLTIRSRAKVGAAGHFAVDIPTGQLVLEACDITCDSLTSVAIHGASADPVIRRCTIHSGAEGGIFVYAYGRGTIEDSDIYGNILSGIAVQSGANPTIRGCRIHTNAASGIYIYGHGRGTIEHCDIYGNAQSGVAIKTEGNPVIRHCDIHASQASGIYVYGDGRGTVEACRIYDNALAGMTMTTGGNPDIRSCDINRNTYQGIRVYEAGAGRVEDCDLTANDGGPWSIEPGCRVQRQRNRVVENRPCNNC